MNMDIQSVANSFGFIRSTIDFMYELLHHISFYLNDLVVLRELKVA